MHKCKSVKHSVKHNLPDSLQCDSFKIPKLYDNWFSVEIRYFSALQV